MVKQVLHILGVAQPESTGMVHIVRSLAAGLDPNHYRVSALFLAGTGQLVSALNAEGTAAHAIDWQRGMLDPLGALRFWRFMRKQQYAIVHVHFGDRAVRGLARAATGARIVRHLHGRILEPKGLAPISFSCKGADAVVAVSEAVAERVIDGKPRVIYAGVAIADDAPRQSRTESKLVLGTAGRLVKLKGIEYLLKASARLKQEFPGLEVQIAGTGPELKELQAEVSRLGLEGRVRFLGWIEEVNSALRSWDVFVMPSLEEGFPIAALNAMAAGLPVVATTVGGIPELIVDGTSGLLVEPGDVEQLVAALGTLLRDRELRVRLGRAGFERVREHFSVLQMTRQFARLYDDLLAGNIS
jgi:glycosyltransferase involved in cell wall biosynthesis